MTPEEKKERRQIRHELQRRAHRHHFHGEFKACATSRQMKAGARKVTDQILAGKNPGRWVQMEGQK